MDKPQHNHKEEPNGSSFFLCQRQRQHRFGPARLVLGKGRLTAVGSDDLLHQMQAQNMRCVLPRLAGLQRRQHGRRVACPVIRDRDDELAAGAVGFQCDGAASGIVPGSILQQILQRPRQQRGIGAQQRLPGFLLQ